MESVDLAARIPTAAMERRPVFLVAAPPVPRMLSVVRIKPATEAPASLSHVEARKTVPLVSGFAPWDFVYVWEGCALSKSGRQVEDRCDRRETFTAMR